MSKFNPYGQKKKKRNGDKEMEKFITIRSFDCVSR